MLSKVELDRRAMERLIAMDDDDFAEFVGGYLLANRDNCDILRGLFKKTLGGGLDAFDFYEITHDARELAKAARNLILVRDGHHIREAARHDDEQSELEREFHGRKEL